MDPGIDLTLARSNRYVSSEISETMQEWNSCDAGGANLLGVPCLLENFGMQTSRLRPAAQAARQLARFASLGHVYERMTVLSMRVLN